MAYRITDEDFDALVRASRVASPTFPPEDAAALFLEESGWNPASPGPASAKPPVGGLNQMSTPNIEALGLTRAQWLAMSAAQQIPHIFRFWGGLAHFNGGRFPSDGGELLGLNFVPAYYAEAGAGANPDAPITGADGPHAWAWNDNPPLHNATGVITVNTLRAYLAGLKKGPRWQAIADGLRAAEERAGSTEPGNPPPAPVAGGGGSGPPPSGAPPAANASSRGILSLALAMGVMAWLALRGRIEV